ncbi:corticotropin-releasing factor receptor 2-like isoform X1 [Haliotis asinina]|uniref:corticotropin-releasing factor receptor 2-like isoform X1 n=1 Tax=Haliotis asinina TaxID=109174 RepID=UPI0035318D48
MTSSTDSVIPDVTSVYVLNNVSVITLTTCDWPDELDEGTLYCPPTWDRYQCWPATEANTTIYGPCPSQYGFNDTVHLAHRKCSENGTWEKGNWTDYGGCIELWQSTRREDDTTVIGNVVRLAEILRDIYFVASIISLAFLILTLFIFSYFKSLQCSRISIHKNLVMSFIFRFILIIVMMEPYISKRDTSYRDFDWLCKTLTALRKYTIVSNFFWMFVEGLFLHNRLAVSVFSTEAPFTLFYVIGWGIPGVITLLWALLMHFYNQDSCWDNHNQSTLIFIIYAPILVTLVINCAFLVNIIRILITKLRANNTIETVRIRKAIKATAVLLPLLGIINILFLLKPEENGSLTKAYRVINAVLPACQGIFISLLYCFMNSEVRGVIKKKWYRFRLSRSMNARARRRNSRTSSFFLSQSEVVFMVSFRNKKIWNKRAPPARDYTITEADNSMRCTCLCDECDCSDCSKKHQFD